ncbi:MAG: DinB family protein [Candidatus Acidiferrales bacterium]
MMAFIRVQVLNCVKGMSVHELDFLLDANANTIGATLFHLAAAETYYQLNTFEEMEWDSWPEAVKKQWDVPMNLGEPARKVIKGNSIDCYLSILGSVREKTLSEFRQRDDDWLAILDKGWGWNNHAKWFHVAEHESNHNGQFKFVRSRFRR